MKSGVKKLLVYLGVLTVLSALVYMGSVRDKFGFYIHVFFFVIGLNTALNYKYKLSRCHPIPLGWLEGLIVKKDYKTCPFGHGFGGFCLWLMACFFLFFNNPPIVVF
jgi:hypothetical protein